MTKPFKITFCGDTSLGYYYLEKGKKKYPEAYDRLQNNPFSFFEGVAPLLEGSDEVIVNLETVLTKNPGDPIEGKEYPGCDDPDATIDVLKRLGVTAVTLANNHAMDFGEEKLVEMIDLLHANGIATIGAGRNVEEARKPYIINLPDNKRKVYILNGMRARKRYIEYGFFADENKVGIASTRFSIVEKQVKEIKDKDPSSLVVYIPHWQGIDYKEVDEKKKQWCRDLASVGVDLIVGHGTHAKDEIEKVLDKNIYYSIGNFVFNSPGRYKVMSAEPYSMVVTASLNTSDELFDLKNNFIASDNKESGFKTRSVTPRSTFSSKLEKAGISISDCLDGFMLEGEYEIYGNKEALVSGVDVVFNNYQENLAFILADENWPKRLSARQNKLSARQNKLGVVDVLKRARNKGFSNFIIPFSKVSEINDIGDKECVVAVDDTWKFFLDFAKEIRKKSNCKVVAVTGSSGKTSTCEMLSLVMKNIYSDDLFTAGGGNRNLFRNSISSLSRLMGYEAAVLEVSASAGFRKHNFFVSPDVAIFTSLSEAHIEQLKNIENIAKVKSDLFTNMPRNGCVILNADMPCADLVERIARKCVDNVILYGESSRVDVRLNSYDFSSGKVSVALYNNNICFEAKELGKHMVLNSIAVIAAMNFLNYDWKRVSEELKRFAPLKGRGATFSCDVEGKKITVIDESYNSNLSSMSASIELLSNYNPQGNGKRIAVLGDMLELGDKSGAAHQELAKNINSSEADLVILVGNEVAETWRKVSSEKRVALFSNYTYVYDFLKTSIIDGDVLLFKASNGIGLGKVVKRLEDFSL